MFSKQPEPVPETVWSLRQQLITLTMQIRAAHGDRGEQYRLRGLQDVALDKIELIRLEAMARR